MNQCTKGKWKVTKWLQGNGFNVFSEEGGFVASVPMNVGIEHTMIEAKANAQLIVTVVNACIKLNPDNPQAAAESISGLYEVCKVALELFVEFDIQNKGVSGISLQLREALAKTEGRSNE